MKYPDEIIAVNAKGKKEARILRSRGQDFVVYGYEDLETGKMLDKYSVLLRKDGDIEHMFIIKLPNGKELVVKHEIEGSPKKRGIFDPSTKAIVYL
jgi:hypothetical protein